MKELLRELISIPAGQIEGMPTKLKQTVTNAISIPAGQIEGETPNGFVGKVVQFQYQQVRLKGH